MGAVPSSFVFFEETAQPDAYDVWWNEDKAIVAARYTDWAQGISTQHGRGRLSLVLPGPIPRLLTRLE
jgi:hypothetical protein